MSLGYHTRLDKDQRVKVCGGGMMSGSLDITSVNNLVNSQFSVTIKQSGRAVFVDREGREVSLYITVDPDATEMGKAAIRLWRVEKEEKERLRQLQAEIDEERIQNARAGMDVDEVIRRLSA